MTKIPVKLDKMARHSFKCFYGQYRKNPKHSDIQIFCVNNAERWPCGFNVEIVHFKVTKNIANNVDSGQPEPHVGLYCLPRPMICPKTWDHYGIFFSVFFFPFLFSIFDYALSNTNYVFHMFCLVKCQYDIILWFHFCNMLIYCMFVP